MSAIEERRRWAAGMIQKAAGLTTPRYGSTEWLALPEGHLAKVAAVCIAAEAYARQGDDLEDNLRAEVEAARLAHKRAEDADYVARVAAHREEWRHLRHLRAVPNLEPEPPDDLYDIGRRTIVQRVGQSGSDGGAA